MNWIHIPSVRGGKCCERPEVVITDISIIHGRPSTKTALVSKRLLESKAGVGAECHWVCVGFKRLPMCCGREGLVAITDEVISLHEGLRLCNCTWLKRQGAHGVATPLTLPHHWLRATRPSLLLSPLRHHNFPLLSLCSFLLSFSNYFVPSSSPSFTSIHVVVVVVFLFLYRKPQHDQRKEQEPKRPHIKKPLNAFMLYMKEMRANVVAECTLKESAAINQILGRRVGTPIPFSLSL